MAMRRSLKNRSAARLAAEFLIPKIWTVNILRLIVPDSRGTIRRASSSRLAHRAIILRHASSSADPVMPQWAFYLGYVHFLDAGDAAAAANYVSRLLVSWTPTRLRKNRGQTAHFARLFSENQRFTLRNGCQTMSDPGFSATCYR